MPRGDTPQQTTSRRGFAAMDPRRQREIASMGGRAVSQDRDHMSAIGREGGKNSHGSGRGSVNSEQLGR